MHLCCPLRTNAPLLSAAYYFDCRCPRCCAPLASSADGALVAPITPEVLQQCVYRVDLCGLTGCTDGKFNWAAAAATKRHNRYRGIDRAATTRVSSAPTVARGPAAAPTFAACHCWGCRSSTLWGLRLSRRLEKLLSGVSWLSRRVKPSKLANAGYRVICTVALHSTNWVAQVTFSGSWRFT